MRLSASADRLYTFPLTWRDTPDRFTHQRQPEKVRIHSPMLGGFFGRHFLYETANPFPQAILLSKAVGRPVKLIWSREEEFLRDALRPMGVTRFRAGLDAQGLPIALEAEFVGEGPTER
jgi:isoquinoline 1-oxidoreductase beta subunit